MNCFTLRLLLASNKTTESDKKKVNGVNKQHNQIISNVK